MVGAGVDYKNRKQLCFTSFVRENGKCRGELTRLVGAKAQITARQRIVA